MPRRDETRQINAIIRALNQVTERVVVKIALDVTANLKSRGTSTGTPVDTGWASANWVPSLAFPRREPAGTKAAVDAARRVQSSGESSVLRYRRRQHRRVFISNNVPYINALNNGRSPQQSAGFVQRAIRKAVTVDIRGFRPSP